jgi:hypothetical protein
METKTNGGVEASSTSLNSHSNRLIYVRYKDHVLFRNSDPKLYEGSNIRETVGWLMHETNEALFLIHDRSVRPLLNEVRETGLIILKSDIIEIRTIRKVY